MYNILSFAVGVLTGYSISHVYELKSIVMSAVQYIYVPNSLEKISKNTYLLTYHHHGLEYKIVLPIKRGPKDIVTISNEYGEDVTDRIRSFLGPNENFHNKEYTPGDLSHDALHFTVRNGETVSFTTHEKIKLP